MQKNLKITLKEYEYHCLITLAFLFIASPVLFLEVDLLVGICNCIGIFLFLTSVRLAKTSKQSVLSIVFLWFALGIRFFSVFGPTFSSYLFVFACFLPFCVLLGIAEQLEHKLERTKHYVLSVLVFPIAYVLICICVVKINLGNIENLANYFFCIPFISYNLSWAGEYLLSFIIMLILSLLSYSVVFHSERKVRIHLFDAIILALVLLITGFFISLNKTSPDYSLNVALATCDRIDIFSDIKHTLSLDERLQMFKSALNKAKSENADMLILNEEYLQVDKKDEQTAIDFCSDEIKKAHIPTLVCTEIITDEGEKNINNVVFFDENGQIVKKYIKNNLVPILESGKFQKGEGGPAGFVQTIAGHDINIALGICYDINNSFFLRQIPDDTELLLIPSWDWDTCNIEQKRTCLKSIEFNTTILKHTYDGFSFASGPLGLTSDMIDFRNTYEDIKMIEVPIWEK